MTPSCNRPRNFARMSVRILVAWLMFVGFVATDIAHTAFTGRDLSAAAQSSTFRQAVSINKATVVIGNGSATAQLDGDVNDARFGNIYELAASPDESKIYVLERRTSPTGSIESMVRVVHIRHVTGEVEESSYPWVNTWLKDSEHTWLEDPTTMRVHTDGDVYLSVVNTDQGDVAECADAFHENELCRNIVRLAPGSTVVQQVVTGIQSHASPHHRAERFAISPGDIIHYAHSSDLVANTTIWTAPLNSAGLDATEGDELITNDSEPLEPHEGGSGNYIKVRDMAFAPNGDLHILWGSCAKTGSSPACIRVYDGETHSGTINEHHYYASAQRMHITSTGLVYITCRINFENPCPEELIDATYNIAVTFVGALDFALPITDFADTPSAGFAFADGEMFVARYHGNSVNTRRITSFRPLPEDTDFESWRELLFGQQLEYLERVADPVDASSGNFIVARQDLQFPSTVVGVGVSRHYNSLDATEGVFGRGWSTVLDVSLVPQDPPDPELPDDFDVVFRGPDGRRGVFEHVPTGGWTSPPGVYGTLSVTGDPEHFELEFLDGTRWVFDDSHLLAEMTTGRGTVEEQTVEVTRGAGEWTVENTTTYHEVVFTDTSNPANGLIDKAETDDGRVVEYTYETVGGVEHLVAVSDVFESPASPVMFESYVIDERTLMIGEVLDGTDTVQVKNWFDPLGRVVFQKLPDGDGVFYEHDLYDSVSERWSTRVVHHAPGSDADITVYEQDADGRVLGIVDTNEAAVQRDFPGGRLGEVTDRRDVQWANEYDAFGRRVKRMYPDIEITDPEDPDWGKIDPNVYEEWLYWDDSDNVNHPEDPSVPTIGDTRVWKYRDAEGEVTEFRYDGDEAVPSKVIDATLAETVFTVNAGLVSAVTDADGVVTQYSFGNECTPAAPPRMLCKQVVDPGVGEGPLNLTTMYEYDAAGNLKKVTSPEGAVWQWTYDAAGRVVSETGPETLGATNGHYPVEYGYDAAGRVWRVSDATNPTAAGSLTDANASVVFTYTDSGLIKTRTVNDGTESFTTTFAYDTAGRPVSIQQPESTATGSTSGNPTTTYTYGPLGRVESVQGPDGVKTFFEYDDDGNQTARIVGADVTSTMRWETDYDARGRVIETRGPVDDNGERETARYSYDDMDRVLETQTGSLNSSDVFTELSQSSLEYDGVGRVRFESALRGTVSASYDDVVSETQWTDAGRLDKAIAPTPGAGTDFDWQTDPKRTITYDYDGAGRLETVTEPNPAGGNLQTTYGYNDDGHLTSQTSPGGILVEFEVDGLGRVEQTERPSGLPTSPATVVQDQTWNARDQLTSVTDWYDPAGSPAPAMSFEYDGRGALREVWDRNGVPVCYDVDERANRVARHSWTDATGKDCTSVTGAITETWSHDLADRVIEARRPQGALHSSSANDLTVTYDAVTGFLDSVTDGEGRSREPTFDDAGRLIEELWTHDASSRTFDYEYDALGRMVSMDDDREQLTQWIYDYGSNLIEYLVPDAAETAQRSTTYTWGIDSTRTGVTYSDGSKLRWRYDSIGRPIAVDSWFYHWIPFVELGWDNDSRLTEHRYATGDYKRWSYNSAGGIDSVMSSLLGEVRVAEITPDIEGRTENLQVRVDGTVVQDDGYIYDNAGQLKEVNATLGTSALYAYDDRGNRTSATVGATTTTFTHNDANQVIEAVRGDIEEIYTWDDAGYRTQWEIIDTADNDYVLERHTINYDAAGRVEAREGIADPGETNESTLYDAQFEHNGLGQRITYDVGSASIWTTWDPIDPLNSPVEAGDGTTILSRSWGGGSTTTWPELYGSTDHNGSAVVNQYNNFHPSTYDPWGNHAGEGYLLGTTYRGEIEVRGHLHLRARDYDPDTAQFTSPDPLDGVDGTTTVANLYHYASNDPLNYSDPSGLCRTSDVVFKVFEGDMSSTVTSGPSGGLDYRGCVDAAGVICDALLPITYDDPSRGGGLTTHHASSWCRPGMYGPACMSAAGANNFFGGMLSMNPFMWFARPLGDAVGRPIDLGAHGVDSSSGCYTAGNITMIAVDVAVPIHAIGSVPGRVPAPSAAAGLTRNADGLFGSNVTQLRTRTSGGFVRDAGGPVRVFQSEVTGGRSAAEAFFTSKVGRAPNTALATDVAEAGGLRYTIRGSSHGAPTVEVFDVSAATVEKIRFL